MPINYIYTFDGSQKYIEAVLLKRYYFSKYVQAVRLMIIRGIKRIAIATTVLILATMLANTAFGKYLDSSSNTRAAITNSIDVQIVERTKSCNCSTKCTSEIIAAISTIEETLSDLAPGDTVVLGYKIINMGSIDVLLDGVNISVDNQQLKDYIDLKWSITQYKDNIQVNKISSCTNELSLSCASASTDVSLSEIILECDSPKNNYCLLELIITYDENSPQLNEVLGTVFTISPSFIQN